MKKFLSSFVGASILTIGVSFAQDYISGEALNGDLAPPPGMSQRLRSQAMSSVSISPTPKRKAEANPAMLRDKDDRAILASDEAGDVSEEVQVAFHTAGYSMIPVPYTAQLFILHYEDEKAASELTEFLTEKAPRLLNEPTRNEARDATSRIEPQIAVISEISVEKPGVLKSVLSVVRDESRPGKKKLIVRVADSDDVQDLERAFEHVRALLDPGPPPSMASSMSGDVPRGVLRPLQ